MVLLSSDSLCHSKGSSWDQVRDSFFSRSGGILGPGNYEFDMASLQPSAWVNGACEFGCAAVFQLNL